MSTSVATPSRSVVAARYVRSFLDRRAALMPTFAALLIFIVLLVGAEIHFGNFVTPLNMSALLLDNAYLVILAVGMTFVIVTGGIDLSVGSVMAFTGILCAHLLADGHSAGVVVPVIILGGAAIGLLIGVLVQYFDVQPFIASLAGLFLARGLAFVVSLSSIRVENDSVLWLQTTRYRFGEWYITPTGILALLVAAIGAFVMQYTRFGRTIYAVGGNEQSARLMGLNVARTKVLVYVISGVCAGLSGLVLTAYSGAGYPRNGIGTELDVIAAVVIGGTLLTGGTGYVLGSVIGVFVFGTIKTIISFMGAEQSWTRIIVGLMLLLFIGVQRIIVYRWSVEDSGVAGGDNGPMETRPLLELAGGTVYFGADAALDAVDFRLFPGEVHSLMGENGAGKSTLIKAITGALPLTEGELRLDGSQVHLGSPHDAQELGIRAVYQEIDLLPNISVAENIALGYEPRRFGVIDWERMRQDAQAVLADLGLTIDPASTLGRHSLAVQQLVAIARAIFTDVRVLVLDEPTSSLDLDECAELFRVIGDLKRRGVAILFVSHFLDQVYELCDRVTVLRDGKLVGEYLTREFLRIDLVHAMLGRSADSLRTRSLLHVADGRKEPYLSARSVSVGSGINEADVDLVEGEVLGVAGLLGSGRTELARALSGIDKLDAGIIRIQGSDESLAGPRSAISLGIVYSSEDRRAEGILSELSVQENITLALQAERGILRRIRRSRQRELALSWIEALDIRPPDPDRPAGTLSGGNQQKVLLARLLAISPRALVLDEPTRGIDVGAKVEVQNLIGELADNGLSVMFISAELEEVLRVANRVAIVQDGRIVDTVPSEELTVDSLTAMVASPDDAPPASSA